jgi:hypothetical protein
MVLNAALLLISSLVHKLHKEGRAVAYSTSWVFVDACAKVDDFGPTDLSTKPVDFDLPNLKSDVSHDRAEAVADLASA